MLSYIESHYKIECMQYIPNHARTWGTIFGDWWGVSVRNIINSRWFNWQYGNIQLIWGCFMLSRTDHLVALSLRHLGPWPTDSDPDNKKGNNNDKWNINIKIYEGQIQGIGKVQYCLGIIMHFPFYLYRKGKWQFYHCCNIIINNFFQKFDWSVSADWAIGLCWPKFINLHSRK